MEIKLKGQVLQKAIECFRKEKMFEDEISTMEFKGSIGGEYHLNILHLKLEDLEKLNGILKSIRAVNAAKMVSLLVNFKKNPETTEIKDLEVFVKMLRDYIEEKSEHRLLFLYDREDDNYQPYFVYHISFNPAEKKEDYLIPSRVIVELHRNGQSGFEKRLIYFESHNVLGRNISEALLNTQILVETKELYEEYEKSFELYKNERNNLGKVYDATNKIKYHDSFYNEYTEIGDKVMVVNNNTEKERKLVYREGAFIWNRGLNSEMFEIPVDPKINCFDVLHKKNVTVDVRNLVDHKFDETLREKLVLPSTHKKLLDILMNKEGILTSGDIIEGKGNGTAILLEGPPGCGKTLTVEVYSELAKRPLYKISIGELYKNGSVEEGLYRAMSICKRLNMIMMLDECETFVKKRGDNLGQNSIVTAFLNKLEYFDGILFMSSNRLSEIDDAILSRCIAAVRYEIPTMEDRKLIWKVLAKQFEVELSDELLNQLLKVFPSLVGRDIKELLKLTIRYCNGLKEKMDIESFVSCAQFRYVEINQEAYNKINK